jgi:hypothetical protein
MAKKKKNPFRNFRLTKTDKSLSDYLEIKKLPRNCKP